MKKSALFRLLIVLFVAVTVLSVVSACNDADGPQHRYHTTDVEPTCENKGCTVYRCADCGVEYRDDYVSALGHDYGDATYTWSEDCSVCVATRVCRRDNSHELTERATVERIVTREATCTSSELSLFVATFSNGAFSTQTVSGKETGAALGHHYVDGYCTECDSCTYTSQLLFDYDGETASVVGLAGNRVENVVIPETYEGRRVTKIEANAFKGKTNIRTVELPDTIVEICSGAFNDCSNLRFITLPKNLQTFDENIFIGCERLHYVLNTNMNLTVSDLDRQHSLTIKIENIINDPNAYITVANDYVFLVDSERDCLIGYIGDDVNLALPDRLIRDTYEIGSYAFYRCSAIETVVIPDTVTSIGSHAFFGCEKLLTAEIGNGVTEIERRAFSNCNLLATVTVGKSLTTVGENAFDCDRLVEIVNNSDLTFTCKSSDYGCIARQASLIHSGKSILNFGEDGFITVSDGELNAIVGCFGAVADSEQLVLPEKLGGKDYIVNDYAFNGGAYTSVIVSDGVTEIGANAFLSCRNLSSIVFGSNVSVIGEMAFAMGYSLEEVTLPDGLTELGRGAFWFSEGLKTVHVGERLEVIGDSAFAQCRSLESFPFPSCLKTIGNQAFYGCNLREIEITGDISFLGEVAFSSCSRLTKVTFGGKIASMGDSVFSHCFQLEEVTFLDGIETVGASCFVGCSSLSRVSLPDSVAKIESGAFRDCRSLKDLTLPSGIKTIGVQAFKGSGITSISLAGVETVGESAFENCGGLTELVISDMKSIGAKAFKSCGGITEVALSGIETLGEEAFENCGGLTKVTVSEVGSIGARAFKGCNGITDFTLGGVETLGESAFENCGGLTEITLTDVTTIGVSAFKGCTALTDVTVRNADSVGAKAFENCTALARVSLIGVAEIDETAFDGCTALEELSASL